MAHPRLHRGPVDFDAIYLGRPGLYGNPIPLPRGADLETRLQHVKAFADDLADRLELIEAIRENLGAGPLGRHGWCWCSPLPCHGDIVMRVADGMTPAQAWAALEGEIQASQVVRASPGDLL